MAKPAKILLVENDPRDFELILGAKLSQPREALGYRDHDEGSENGPNGKNLTASIGKKAHDIA